MPVSSDFWNILEYIFVYDFLESDLLTDIRQHRSVLAGEPVGAVTPNFWHRQNRHKTIAGTQWEYIDVIDWRNCPYYQLSNMSTVSDITEMFSQTLERFLLLLSRKMLTKQIIKQWQTNVNFIIFLWSHHRCSSWLGMISDPSGFYNLQYIGKHYPPHLHLYMHFTHWSNTVNML